MMNFRPMIFAVLALLVLSIAVPAKAAYETGGVVKTILNNGVVVLVKPEPESKVAAVEVFVRVGAEDEADSSTGIGQLLAGSILAKTNRHSTMKLARLVAEAGGNFHAQWQWNYMEAYAVTLPNSCEEAISLLADAIQNSAVDGTALDYSRNTILNEIKRQEDDPFNSAYTAVRRLLYRGAPYDRWYLGDPTELKSITQEQVDLYYKDVIRRSPVTVCVVGNVDPKRVIRKVETCFKHMDLRTDRPSKLAPARVVSHEASLGKSASTTYIMVGYTAPGVGDPDYAAMCVANVLLGGNKSSRLFTKLREEQGLGYQVGSQYPPLRGASHLVAYLGMDSGRATPEAVASVKATMLEQVKAVINGEFSDDDLERAKRYLIGKHALSHERTRDRAFYLGWSEIIGLGYQADLPNTFRDRITKVTREEITRTSTRYLSEPIIVVSR